MSRLRTLPAGRRWSARAGAALAGLLAVAGAFVAAPAGASNQSVTFTLTPIHFGSVVLGTSTTGQSIVTNTTNASLYFVGAHPDASNLGAEFHASAGTCTGALAANASCNLSVVFAPTHRGLRASTLTVRFAEHNAKGAPTISAAFTTALHGRGLLPTFTLSDASAGSVQVGQIGTAQATITNTSIIPLTVHGFHLQSAAANVFNVSAITCPSPVLPGGSCAVEMTFTPHRSGGASATLSVAMLLAGTKSSLVVEQGTVSGSGTLKGGASPPFELSSLNFGTVTVGTTATGDVVLTNTSLHNETFTKDWFKANASGAFAVTGNDCPPLIAPASSCNLTLTYSPSHAVTNNATLVVQVTHLTAKLATVSSTAQTSLTGKGENPDFTLSADPFPTTTVGSTVDGQVTVTNTSLVTLAFDGVDFQGANQSSWALVGSACGSPLAPSGSCALNVAFSPKGQGLLSVTLEAELSFSVRSHVVHLARRAALEGNGLLPSFTVSAPTLAATPKGVAVSGIATLANGSSVSLTYAGFHFSGPNAADFSVTKATCSGLLPPAGSCDLTVQFTPTGASPGTESAVLKVTVVIAGTVPPITTSVSQPVSGQET